ncbi:molybdenum cofactor guanylyltransferase [Halorientalis brevis]|uniref:Probable molybdenum cofactor guanylyltransferase n=1 Tax=Halorientalis brevis TaxID=1126241 RepID=A0ABD6CIL2_9EURY|nr:molybdenum cofactor guanylyltransferase [Halorientalis brevis]
MRSGVILAGGYSTRFGDEDKATADLAGEPMIRRVADRLEGVVDDLVVNCRAEQRARLEAALAGVEIPVQYAEDPEPDQGPMAGIMTGLREADGEYAAVVACDMPFVDASFLDYLFERAAGHDAAVPQVEDEWFQTTQAVYRTEPMAQACAKALADDEHKIVVPLFRLDYVVVDAAEIREHATEDTFRNVNTREKLETARSAFGDE